MNDAARSSSDRSSQRSSVSVECYVTGAPRGTMRPIGCASDAAVMTLPPEKQPLLDTITARLAAVPGVVAVVLGGSYARGMARPDSDPSGYVQRLSGILAHLDETAAELTASMRAMHDVWVSVVALVNQSSFSYRSAFKLVKLDRLAKVRVAKIS